MNSKWIPVTKELPQAYTFVLVYCTKYGVKISSYEKKSFYIDDDYGYMETINPTHWMPLPKAPNGMFDMKDVQKGDIVVLRSGEKYSVMDIKYLSSSKSPYPYEVILDRVIDERCDAGGFPSYFWDDGRIEYKKDHDGDIVSVYKLESESRELPDPVTDGYIAYVMERT